MKDELVSEEKNKPVLDEQTLAKLLEAAYVLQEHNREMRELELGFELKRDRDGSEGRGQRREMERLFTAARDDEGGEGQIE